MRSNAGVGQQDLEAHLLPGGVDQLAVLHRPASLAQQVERAAQPLAVVARPVGHRQAERRGEQLGRQLGAERLQQRQFGPLRHAGGGVFAAAVVALGPANTGRRTGSCSSTGSRTPRSSPAARAGRRTPGGVFMANACMPVGRSTGSASFFTSPCSTAGKSYAVAQFLATFSLPEIHLARLERLERHGRVAEILVADGVEIVQPAAGRQLLPPTSPGRGGR